MITRLRLKQAFGRLVRRGDDHGVFVLLDPMMPSRLAGAFPEGGGGAARRPRRGRWPACGSSSARRDEADRARG
jgi:hypothetical protein